MEWTFTLIVMTALVVSAASLTAVWSWCLGIDQILTGRAPTLSHMVRICLSLYLLLECLVSSDDSNSTVWEDFADDSSIANATAQPFAIVRHSIVQVW